MSVKNFGDQKWDEKIESLGNYTPCELFNNNQEAYEVALILIRTCNIWDDLIDKDNPVTNAEIHYSYISILHDLQRNPFYKNYESELFSTITSSILSYLCANEYEETEDEHGLELGHMLRYGPVLSVCYIIYLCNGFEKATTLYPIVIKGLCSERFNDYKTEIMGRKGAEDAS